jgi:nucleotide-binding universal stress UspA family protein
MPLSRIVAAIDGTRAGYEAARQAGQLVSAGGTVRLLAIADPYFAAMNTWAGQRLVTPEDVVKTGGEYLAKETLLVRARESVDFAKRQLPKSITIETDVVEGPTHDVLVDAAKDARVMVLGSHGGGRMTGMVLTSTATDMLRHAPCSVLVARPPFDEDYFPSSVAVAVDGSEPSIEALAVARGIVDNARRAIPLRVVVAGRADISGVPESALAGLTVEQLRGRAVSALAKVGEGVDLIVMGARGLQGAKALGSVSERVAHRASSSVLVVRPHA